ncbi:MAG TPA: hypothetical protein VL992_04120 [Tepidisphaeraceae bacterium]|nr:hypothetical protein [Tepidisphaeraceae bacterium]
MFGFTNRPGGDVVRVNARLCTDKFKGGYPHVGLFDCRERKTWIARPLSGQAIRTAHARLITGAGNSTSTVWKDRFLCFWFYTPNTGEGFILGYPIDWEEAHVLVRIDPQWDYDRQRLIPPELTDQTDDNLKRQFKHGDRIVEFFRAARLSYPFNVHFIGQRATDSVFYAKRVEGVEK